MTTPPREPAPYTPTMFDRHGAGAADTVRAAAFGLMVFGIAVGAWMLQSLHLSLGVVFWSAVAGACTTGISLLLSRAAGAGWQHVMFSGASTPYEEQFSYQESLVMRGLVDDALASYETVIAEKPAFAAPRLRAAALYASRGSNPQRAAELLRDVQGLAGLTVRDDVAATNRLVELLTGPLGDPGRAMAELRRLIDRHPGTDAASRAKLVLAELKQEMAARSGSPP